MYLLNLRLKSHQILLCTKFLYGDFRRALLVITNNILIYCLFILQVVYFTSMFPYLVLTIFFVRGITLKGASEGLAHMFRPKVKHGSCYTN